MRKRSIQLLQNWHFKNREVLLGKNLCLRCWEMNDNLHLHRFRKQVWIPETWSLYVYRGGEPGRFIMLCLDERKTVYVEYELRVIFPVTCWSDISRRLLHCFHADKSFTFPVQFWQDHSEGNSFIHCIWGWKGPSFQGHQPSGSCSCFGHSKGQGWIDNAWEG